MGPKQAEKTAPPALTDAARQRSNERACQKTRLPKEAPGASWPYSPGGVWRTMGVDTEKSFSTNS
jgi:hypothetical protein